MSNLTVAQVAEFLIKVIGACLLIVVLSYPIQGLARYIQTETTHRQPAQQTDSEPRKVDSWIPTPLKSLFGSPKPANSLVPPPPPIPYQM